MFTTYILCLVGPKGSYLPVTTNMKFRSTPRPEYQSQPPKTAIVLCNSDGVQREDVLNEVADQLGYQKHELQWVQVGPAKEF